jgi:hypothetical protein
MTDRALSEFSGMNAGPLTLALPLVRSERFRWLFSRRMDFWLASGGASLGILAALVVLSWHGDRELDVADLILSELHLGATYGAVMQRRAWRGDPVGVLLMPTLILVLTYILTWSDHAIWLTSIIMYTAVWHRGRQSLGLARFYQRAVGGPVSEMHRILFRGAIYLPMLASMFAFTLLGPSEYEGDPYLALRLGETVTIIVGLTAFIWVVAYLVWMLPLEYRSDPGTLTGSAQKEIHPGEWWVVLAHAIAFGSAYTLGATHASFILVLAVYHEVQYLSFTYAMARGAAAQRSDGQAPPSEIETVVGYLCWPVIACAGVIAGAWFKVPWLAPLGAGGLLCHYWLDSRIWTSRPRFQTATSR